MSELAEIWNLGILAMSLSIRIVRFSKRTLDLVTWKTSHLIWDKDFFWNTQVIWDRWSIFLYIRIADQIPYNILEPMALQRVALQKFLIISGPPKRNQSNSGFKKNGRTIRTETTCVTKVKEMHMWQWRNEHNYLEKE